MKTYLAVGKVYMMISYFSELGQLSGVAAILRYPMHDEDDESDEDS